MLWPALAAFALALGYWTLAGGGTRVAPVLLVLGYAVLVPAAVMGTTDRRPESAGQLPRRVPPSR